jgi:hypothetical protein
LLDSLPPWLERWVLAHEIGHAFNEHPSLALELNALAVHLPQNRVAEEEAEAEAFALEILCPRQLFRRRVGIVVPAATSGTPIGALALDALARAFEVPLSVAAQQYVGTTLFPAALVTFRFADGAAGRLEPREGPAAIESHTSDSWVEAGHPEPALAVMQRGASFGRESYRALWTADRMLGGDPTYRRLLKAIIERSMDVRSVLFCERRSVYLVLWPKPRTRVIRRR